MKKIFFISALSLLATGLLLDLVFLNWQAFSDKGPKRQKDTPEESIALPSPTITSDVVSDFACPKACLSQIYEATSSLKLPTPIPQKLPLPVSQQQEFIITFGAGSTKNRDWENITGASVNIDSTKYGKIKSVVFETTLQIPNGNQGAYVRLYNATDGRVVWPSEMYHEGGAVKLLTSQPLTLDSGNKLYQVQAKVTVGDIVNINQSRLKITSE